MLNQIRAIETELSKSERKVAQAVLVSPQQFVKATMNELAHISGVSEPTIVRFCRRLKLSGYREFRLRLAQELAGQLHYQHSQIEENDDASQLVNKVINSAISSLSKVRDQLSAEIIDQVIALFAAANHIEIYGLGGAGIVVQDAQLKFARLGLNSQPYIDIYLQRVAAGMLEPGSCVLAISISGRSKDLLESIKIARHAGANIVSITASASPLAALSDLHLAVDLDDDKNHLEPIKARIAHMAVVDTLAIGLAVRCKPAYLERLRQANLALSNKFTATT
ncbi:MAG: MurR/RpiR family transcriptional regulator [Gammaproteobacteria bacterium]|nr:MurR/RpiR family transcriptional regulator [Gammaproteobacteria bacterium]